MDFLCCLCECCCGDNNKYGAGAAGCCYCFFCCYSGYKENVSGHRRRTYRFLNIILVLILTVVAVVLSAIVLSQNSTSSIELKSIMENWQQGVFLDIQLSKNCASNYEVLSQYEIRELKLDVYVKRMENFLIPNAQIGKHQQVAITFNLKAKLFWTNGLSPQIIPTKQFKYADQDLNQNFMIYQKKKKLPKMIVTKWVINLLNLKSKKFYCVLQEEPCPIRDIKILQNQLSDQEKELNGYSLIYDTGFYVYTSTSTESNPLVNLQIVKGRGVCFDDNKLSLNPKLEEDYLLLTPQPEDCEIDNTYFQIAKSTEKALFNVNNVEVLVERERPLYNISKIVEYQLLAQNQIYYKQECRIDNYRELKNLGDKFKAQNELITCQLVFTCFLFCVILLFFFAETFQCCKKDCNCCYSIIYVIVKEISIYLFGITVIVSYSFMMDLVLSLQEQNRRNCFVSTAQERLKSIYDTQNGTSLSLSYCLLIDAGLMIIIDFIMQTFLCFKILEKRLKKISNKLQNNGYNNKIKQYVQNYLQNGQQQPEQNMYQTPNQNGNQQPYLQQIYHQVDPFTVQNNPVPYIQNQEYQYYQPPQQYYVNQVQEQQIQQEQIQDQNNLTDPQKGNQAVVSD